MRQQRQECGWVMRRNGAWLIDMERCDSHLGRGCPSDFYDAAASVRQAKRIAEEIVAKWGWEGPYRWRRETPNRYILLGYDKTDEDTSW